MRLKAGQVDVLIEPATGFLRQVAWGGFPLVNAIYFAIRESNWATVPAQWRTESSETASDSFHVHLTGTAPHGDWVVTMTGDPTRLRYEVRFVAKREFSTARTGLCLLHPREQAGLPATGFSRLGGREQVRTALLPTAISPHQPFTELEALTIMVEDRPLKFTFEGQTFEMEDQRNWGDASYKTYVRSNHLGPFTIKEGEVVEQAIEVDLSAFGAAKPIRHQIGDLAHLVSPAPVFALQGEAAGVTTARRVGLPDLAGVSKTSPVLVEVDRIEWNEEGLIRFSEQIRTARSEVGLEKTTLLVDPQRGEPSFWDRLAALVAPAKLAVNMRSNFTELNRLRPWLHRIPEAGWQFTPIVHMRDARSVLETPATLDDQMHSLIHGLGGERGHVKLLEAGLEPFLEATFRAGFLAQALSAKNLLSLTVPAPKDPANQALVDWCIRQLQPSVMVGRPEVSGPVYAATFGLGATEGILLAAADLDVAKLVLAPQFQGAKGTLWTPSGPAPITLGVELQPPQGLWFLLAEKVA